MTDSWALFAFPIASMDALSVVPFCRVRGPFSYSEVALVQAVEKLGIGRWLDVKLGAFESAKHHTYVDLKDKWKTLVQTARIPTVKEGRVLARTHYGPNSRPSNIRKQHFEALVE